MENYDYNSDELDKLFRNILSDGELSTNFIIITGKTGIGKTEIVKQYLSRTKTRKYYSDGINNFTISAFMNLNSYIAVFDNMDNSSIENIDSIMKEDFENKETLIIFITRFEETANLLEKKIDSYICNDLIKNCEGLRFNVKSCFNSVYLSAPTIYSSEGAIKGPKGYYWGEEEISNIY